MSDFLKWLSIGLSILNILLMPLTAKDCGVYGHLFPIEEEDLLDNLKNKLKNMPTGELEKMQIQVRNQYISRFNAPTPVEGLKEAKIYRCFYVDPTICADQEIKDHEGHVIISKGTCINPLDSIFHLEALLFFDGSNPKHLKWARNQNQLVKWVLTKGKPLEMEEKENHPTYFDQFGVLVKKFGIKHLPAKVSKDGLKLKVEEFSLEG